MTETTTQELELIFTAIEINKLSAYIVKYSCNTELYGKTWNSFFNVSICFLLLSIRCLYTDRGTIHLGED